MSNVQRVMCVMWCHVQPFAERRNIKTWQQQFLKFTNPGILIPVSGSSEVDENFSATFIGFDEANESDSNV